MRRFLVISFIFGLLFIFSEKLSPIFAADPVNLYFFYSTTCLHCQAEAKFLQNLENELAYLQVHAYEASDNVSLLVEVSRKLKFNPNSVPITIIGDQVILGYLNDQTTGANIERLVQSCYQNKCPDSIAPLVSQSDKPPLPQPSPPPAPNLPAPADQLSLNLPFFGQVNPKNYSLPIFTIIIAGLDGFNPCAMWVLVFLITLLLGMKNRRKMWLLGTTFITVSAFVYFLFLAAWLNLLLFLGFVVWIRVIIGIIAIASGLYQLREFTINRAGECKVTKSPQKRQVFQQLKVITQSHSLLLALIGIILLAFAVNLVELICSAGLPAVYTQVLALSALPIWQYYLYLLLYIFIFMLDDLLVFIAAMATLRLTKLTGQYSRYSNLIGGLIIAIVGFLLIFKPEWIMFK